MFGPAPFIGGKRFEWTYLDNTADLADRSTYNFNNRAVPSPTSDQLFIVGVYGFAALPGFSGLVGVNLNGAPATIIESPRILVDFGLVKVTSIIAIAAGIVPDASDVDVQVGFSNPLNRCAITYGVLNGYKSDTPHNNNSAAAEATATSISTSLSVPSKGFVFAVHQRSRSSAASNETTNWTNAEKNSDENFTEAGEVRQQTRSCAEFINPGGLIASRTITASSASGHFYRMIAAVSWR